MSTEKQSYRGLAWTSWILVAAVLILGVIPFISFFGWFLVLPIMLVVVILAIIILTRGGTAQGIFLILISVFVLPLWAFFAPIVSSVVFSALTSEPVENHEDPGIEDLMEGVEVPLDPDALPLETPTE